MTNLPTLLTEALHIINGNPKLVNVKHSLGHIPPIETMKEPPTLEEDNNRGVASRQVVVDEAETIGNLDEPSKRRVYNWKSASRRMIEERKGLF